jgi:rhodanese-related sulfurtransferase
MNKIVVIAIVAILGLGGLFIVTQSGKKTDASASKNIALSIQTVKDDINSGGQLIDVRTPAEYADGHIDGAVNLSLQNIQSGALPSAQKDKPVYVYCRSGNRSSEATVLLKAAGYQNIIDLGAITQVQSIGGVIKT